MSAFKNRKELVVFKVPYFSTIPWSSAFIPLCLSDWEFNFISTVPEIESPLKKVEYLDEVPLRSVNLCLCRPWISLKIILQFGLLKILFIYLNYI